MRFGTIIRNTYASQDNHFRISIIVKTKLHSYLCYTRGGYMVEVQKGKHIEVVDRLDLSLFRKYVRDEEAKG